MVRVVPAQRLREGRGMLLAVPVKTSSYTVYFFVRFGFVLQLVPKYFSSVVSVVFILFVPWDISVVRDSCQVLWFNFAIPLLYGLLW